MALELRAGGRLPPVYRTRGYYISAGITGLLGLAIGFLPLFSEPGYESALAAGLLLPGLAGVTTALESSRHAIEPSEALSRGCFAGVLYGLAFFVTTLLHALFSGFCDPGFGVLMFALGPLPGAALGGGIGGLLGPLAARIARRRLRTLAAVMLGLAAPLAGIVLSLWRFYASPMVFAFDPFFGYFAGPLYDTIIEPLGELAIYRVGTAATLFALLVFSLHVERAESGRLRVRWLGRPGLAALGAVAAAGSLAHCVFGSELGHYSTRASIERALGKALSSERCDVVFSHTLLERDVRLLGRECDAHIRQIERYFRVQGPARVTVFLFSSPEEKERLMGAANTYIAKPWRNEVYLQPAGYPHPVLGHELAHVVTGAFGSGPFRVAGPGGGWIPDPGRIEGFAVAASPHEDDELTSEQWARAMLDLKLLPPLNKVFRLSFLGQNSSTAYTVAGAFVSYVGERFGPDALKRWYAGADLASVTGGKTLADLERDWRASLLAVNVTAAVKSAAKTRFDRPAVFGRRCPHVVDELFRDAGRHLGQNDPQGAEQRLNSVLARDDSHFGARLALGHCSAKRGDLESANQRFESVATDGRYTVLQRAQAVEARGDLALWAGQLEPALAAYDLVSAAAVDEDQLRALEVKRLAARPEAREAVVSLLVGEPRLGRDMTEAAAKLAEWSAREPSVTVPLFLLGKNLFNSGRWSSARDYLDRALGGDLLSPRIRRETLRVRLMVACAEQDRAAAVAAYERWEREPGSTDAQRLSMRRFAERCGVP